MTGFGDLATRAGACTALTYDRDRMLEALACEEAAPGSVAIQHDPLAPAGRGQISVLGLVQHVAMWDEIVLAILSEARHGRAHWSLDRLWAPVEAGRALNVGGVEADGSFRQSLWCIASVRCGRRSSPRSMRCRTWNGRAGWRSGMTARSRRHCSGLCQFASSPEADPARTRTYRHACLHLGIDAN